MSLDQERARDLGINISVQPHFVEKKMSRAGEGDLYQGDWGRRAIGKAIPTAASSKPGFDWLLAQIACQSRLCTACTGQ